MQLRNGPFPLKQLTLHSNFAVQVVYFNVGIAGIIGFFLLLFL
jgi:hypothetical protein